MLTKIYPSEMYHVHEEIYNDLRKRAGKYGDEKSETVGIIDALCHKNYRFATWLVLYIVLAI